jgi:hypothetical protein
MSVELRLSGEPDEIAAALEVLRDVYEVAARDRTYPNQGGFGVRMYAEIRPRSAAPGPVRASAQRADQGTTAVTGEHRRREIAR